MKKIFALVLSIVLCFVLIGCGAKSTDGSAEDDTQNSDSSGQNTPSGGEANSPKSDEEKVIAMFLSYAQRDSDGAYRFRQVNNYNNTTFLYNFVYSPAYKMYNANILVTSHTSMTLYDYAAVTFSWGQFKNGLFTAYHELASVARIDFKYNIVSYTANNIGAQYSYTVQSNSFSNLTAKSDIDSYAATGYEVLQQTISYMNSVLYSHNLSVSLF